MDLISLGSLFSRESSPLLGIDISSTSLKLVELHKGRDGVLVLQHCASEPLERGWVNEGNVEKFDEVAEAMRRLVRKSGSATKNVAMALPGSAVITKKVNFPAGLSDDELEIQVESEASQYIPFPLEEVSLDFCVIGASSNVPDNVEVLLAASRKEKVLDRQGLAEAAGLNPVVLDVESYASRLAASRVIETLPNRGRNMLIALFELGSQSSSLQVIRNDEMIYERDQSFGGAQLTQMIARHYGMSFEDAENKKRSGGVPSDYAESVLGPFMEGVGQDIGRALQFFFTSTPHNKVGHVLISGGAAATPGLDVAVMNHTSFPCKVVNPFDGMVVGAKVSADLMRKEGTSFLVATGLAMRRFTE